MALSKFFSAFLIAAMLALAGCSGNAGYGGGTADVSSGTGNGGSY